MPENNKAVWPGWNTTRLIGRGSFGAVYEIERDVFGHTEKAALKHMTIPQNDGDVEELRDSGYDDESITDTFKAHLENIVNEYTLMREMNGSANVVNCDDFSILPRDNDIGWDILIKMELLTPLTKAISGKATEEQVLQLADDMCSALILCKKYNIIHRDIKPQNIFVSKNGDYKLGDFGIAKTMERTSGGTKIGTYKYMAPEVYNNKPYNQTADIYSLGLVLHWLLNDKRAPFMPLPPEIPRATDEENARQRRFDGEALPAPAHGSEGLKRIVLKACAYYPADRYQSAEEMQADLKTLKISTYTGDKANTSQEQQKKTESAPKDQAQPNNFQPDDDATVRRWQGTQPVDDSDATAGAWQRTEPLEDSDAAAGAWQRTVPVDDSDANEGVWSSPDPINIEKPKKTPIKKNKVWVWIAVAVAAITLAAVFPDGIFTSKGISSPDSAFLEALGNGVRSYMSMNKSSISARLAAMKQIQASICEFEGQVFDDSSLGVIASDIINNVNEQVFWGEGAVASETYYSYYQELVWIYMVDLCNYIEELNTNYGFLAGNTDLQKQFIAARATWQSQLDEIIAFSTDFNEYRSKYTASGWAGAQRQFIKYFNSTGIYFSSVTFFFDLYDKNGDYVSTSKTTIEIPKNDTVRIYFDFDSNKADSWVYDWYINFDS